MNANRTLRKSPGFGAKLKNKACAYVNIDEEIRIVKPKSQYLTAFSSVSGAACFRVRKDTAGRNEMPVFFFFFFALFKLNWAGDSLG